MLRYFITKNRNLQNPDHVFHAHSDADAIKVATRFIDRADIDLWEGINRHVATFDAKKS